MSWGNQGLNRALAATGRQSLLRRSLQGAAPGTRIQESRVAIQIILTSGESTADPATQCRRNQPVAGSRPLAIPARRGSGGETREETDELPDGARLAAGSAFEDPGWRMSSHRLARAWAQLRGPPRPSPSPRLELSCSRIAHVGDWSRDATEASRYGSSRPMAVIARLVGACLATAGASHRVARDSNQQDGRFACLLGPSWGVETCHGYTGRVPRSRADDVICDQRWCGRERRRT